MRKLILILLLIPASVFGQNNFFWSHNTSSTTLPTVITTNVTAITSSTATGGGNITSDGGSSITLRGVCWRTTPNPNLSDSHTSDGNSTGTFTSSITGLSGGTTYYVRAYASNSLGNAYGNQVSFTTPASGTLPTVTTTAISSIAATSASSGGNVTSDGGSSVTVRGVCWSTSTAPTVSGSHSSDGTGTGVFTSSITGLSSCTYYYVRAYATNTAGTSYGEEFVFISLGPTARSVQWNLMYRVADSNVGNNGNFTSSCGDCSDGWAAKVDGWAIYGTIVYTSSTTLSVGDYLYDSGKCNPTGNGWYIIQRISTETNNRIYVVNGQVKSIEEPDALCEDIIIE